MVSNPYSFSLAVQPNQSALQSAIAEATPDQLRQVLLRLCGLNKENKNIASNTLLPEEGFNICKTCNEEYEIDMNSKTCCKYHPGKTNLSSS
jgi:hypothetical protein